VRLLHLYTFLSFIVLLGTAGKKVNCFGSRTFFE